MEFKQAESYNSSSAGQREEGLVLAQLLSLQRGDKVLDLGCGTGYLTKMLADKVSPDGKVLGIDPDLERLTVARDKYSTSNTQYQQASSENIPGQDYDIVFSNYVLHWVKDKHPFFHNVHKCLKPGGKFGFVSVSNFDYPWGMFSPRDGFSPEFLESRQDILFSFTTEEFVGVAATHHFETLHMQEDVREWDFDDVDKLVEYYMTHAYGRFDRTHFNIPVLQKYYEGRKISFRIPYVTTILRKPL